LGRRAQWVATLDSSYIDFFNSIFYQLETSGVDSLNNILMRMLASGENCFSESIAPPSID
jgi:hypothetical protein